MTVPFPYALSPSMAAFVRRTQEFTPVAATIAAQRDAYRRMAEAFTPPRPAGVSSVDLNLAGPAAPLPVRRYQPPGLAPAGGWPAVLYCHGGGWSVGDLDSHDFITAALCASLPAVVLAIDYRLTPEHPFPAAFDDCLAAWQGLQRDAAALGIDPRRVALAGDSAGGNLAAAISLAVRDTGGWQPRGQALIYPALAAPSTVAEPMPSHREHAQAPLLTWADMQACWAAYAPEPVQHRDWRVAPLSATDLSGLPPAFVAVAELDPLRDEGVRYADRLRRAGGAAELFCGRGLVHGCLRAFGACPETARLYAALVSNLRRLLG